MKPLLSILTLIFILSLLPLHSARAGNDFRPPNFEKCKNIFPVYVDDLLYSVELKEKKKSVKKEAKQKSKQKSEQKEAPNFIYISEELLPGGEAFISVLGAPPDDKEERPCQKVEIWFDPSVTPRQLTSEQAIEDAVARGEITLRVTQQLVNCKSHFIQITRHPQSVGVRPGETAVFSVEARAQHKIAYQWQFNGVDIPRANGPTLKVRSVQSQNAGAYTVLVFDHCFFIESRPAMLGLFPTISASPLSQQLICGSNVTFSVVANGTGLLLYQWLKNRVPIPGATSSTLTLSNLGPADLGHYQVIIGNALGAITSPAATLSAQEFIPQVLVFEEFGLMSVCWPLTCIKYRLEESVDMKTWTTTPGAIEVADGSNCVLVAISNKSFRLIPTDMLPPLIVTEPVGGSFPIGSSTGLVVEVVGTGPFLFQWRLNGENLRDQTNAFIDLPNLQLTNFGTYEVEVGAACDVTSSHRAILTPAGFPNVLQDQFALRTNISGAQGTVVGSNVGAGIDPGEQPLIPGLPGGRTLWITWTAPARGEVTFTTEGSSFDTFLAAFRGPSLGRFAAVEDSDDDDRADFKAGRIRFTAFAGQRYHIGVDGFVGASGNVVLSWNFLQNGNLIPQLFSQPQDLLLLPGATGGFRVGAMPPIPSVGELMITNVEAASGNITVSFNDEVEEASAENIANYSISSIDFISAVLVSTNTRLVILTAKGLAVATTYTLVVNNIKDRAVPANTIATNSQFTFTSFSPPIEFLRASSSLKPKKVLSSFTGGLGYQWLFNGNIIPTQNGPGLVNVVGLRENVGIYSVLVTLGSVTIESRRVMMQIVAPPTVAGGEPVQFVRKIDFDFTAPPAPEAILAASLSKPITKTRISEGAGGQGSGGGNPPIQGTVVADNSLVVAAIAKPSSCRQIAWIPFYITNLVVPTGYRTLSVNTTGSTSVVTVTNLLPDLTQSIETVERPLDTILPVFVFLSRPPVRCNNNAPGFEPASVIPTFNVTPGTDYKVYVDIPNGIRGKIHLNFELK